MGRAARLLVSVDSGEELDPTNPHGLCTWKTPAAAGCAECPNAGVLQCRREMKYLGWFAVGIACFMVPALIGFVEMLGENLPLAVAGLVAWGGYTVVFFLGWEPGILCAHCPYYAEGEARVLHCAIHPGFPKRATYDPRPMSRAERVQFLVGIGDLSVVPVVFLVAGGQFPWAALALGGTTIWAGTLVGKACKTCVNFSCPLNRVPKQHVDAFLRRNPAMRAAWEAEGYALDPVPGAEGEAARRTSEG